MLNRPIENDCERRERSIKVVAVAHRKFSHVVAKMAKAVYGAQDKETIKEGTNKSYVVSLTYTSWPGHNKTRPFHPQPHPTPIAP